MCLWIWGGRGISRPVTAAARAFLVGTYRYGLRIEAYVGLLTDEYPPFSLAA